MPFISHRNRNVLFIHIPKTGGSSIEHWMRSFGPLHLFSVGIPPFSKCTPQHYTFNDIRSLFEGSFFDYAFTVVRNPYARIESEYRMRWLLARESHWTAFPTFSQWIETQLDGVRRHKWQLDNHLRPQTEFLGSSLRVFRFEDGLNTILRQVSQEANLPYDGGVGHKLSTSGFDGMLGWDLQDRLQVNAFYGEDFRHLGYTMIDAA